MFKLKFSCGYGKWLIKKKNKYVYGVSDIITPSFNEFTSDFLYNYRYF